MSCILLVGCGLVSKPWEIDVLPQVLDAEVSELDETQVVKIWVIAPLSWPGASYWQDVVEVVDRFGKKFNDIHDDVTLSWIVENGGCNGKDAASAARKLLEVDNVVAIIGGVCSSETLSAWVLAQEAWVMLLAPGSASSKISDIGDYVARTNNNTRAWKTLVDALDETYTHALVITEQKDYPQDMADRFVDAFAWEVTYISYQSDDSDMKVLAKQVAELTEPDALFMFSQSEATSIPLALALEDEWVLDKYKNRIYGANNLLVAPFMERLGDEAEGMKEVNVASVDLAQQDDAYMDTLSDYKIQWDGFTVLQAADAFMMITQVVETSKTSTSPQDIYDYVYSFSQDMPYKWYLWEYWFDSVGDAVGIDFEMYEIVNGQRVVQKNSKVDEEKNSKEENQGNINIPELLFQDWSAVAFTIDAWTLSLPMYMKEILTSIQEEMYTDAAYIHQWFVNKDWGPVNNMSVRVLSYIWNDQLEPKYMNIIGCMEWNEKLCTNIATSPAFSTSFGNIQEVLPIEKNGEVIGLWYIGSTYQDLPWSIDVQLVFPTNEYLVYVTQTIYAHTDSVRWDKVEQAWDRAGDDDVDYGAYFDEFVTNSAYAKNITAVLMNMMETISLEP